jgi:hypothetical protein
MLRPADALGLGALLFIEPPLKPSVIGPPLVNLGEDGSLISPRGVNLKGLKIIDAALMFMGLG